MSNSSLCSRVQTWQVNLPIRQVALLVLMAHMGSFIADHARIGVRDRIFTRVGAMAI